MMIGAVLLLGEDIPFGSYSRSLFLYTAVAYAAFGLLCFAAIIPRKPHFALD